MAAPTTIDFSNLNSKLDALTKAVQANTAAQPTKPGTGGTGGAGGKPKGSDMNWAEAGKAVGSAAMGFVDAARTLASQVGTTLPEAFRLNKNAFGNAVQQITTKGIEFAATMDQIMSVYTSATDAFINVPKGMQLSTDASAEFASDLKKVFGGEFELTAQSLRNFAVLGLDTTAELQAFKDSTGRAGFSTRQLETIMNKNMPSLLIFGNNAAKSAINLERLGISLESFRMTQQGVVTNLEGTLDTVNQLNQLGANIDLETFVRLSELGTPEETFRYLDSVIPDALLRTSTSFRALTEQLPGVKVEDLLRGGMESSVQNLEQRLTELAEPNGVLDIFTQKILATANAVGTVTSGPGVDFGTVIKKATGAALVGLATLQPQFAPVAGPLGGYLLGNDMVSEYGNRTLVTPTGNVALNNNDTIIAGTNLLPKGSVQMADNSALMTKIDRFIDTVNNATTTINIDGRVQTVNRIQLAEVNTRYQRA
jgi:hypothetical protein